jgi:hypothetical protein
MVFRKKKKLFETKITELKSVSETDYEPSFSNGAASLTQKAFALINICNDGIFVKKKHLLQIVKPITKTYGLSINIFDNLKLHCQRCNL